MPKPDPTTIRVLELALACARKGEIQDVFILGRSPSGEYDYDYWTQDHADMLYELGTVILKERSQEQRSRGKG
jgi:hypothetical protein